MKTIVLERPGSFVRTEGPKPVISGPDEALVKVHRVGVCGTDLHAYLGRQPFFTYPRILGHELGVEILEIGPNDQGLKAGDRCAVEPYVNCGQCIACRRGKPNCCVNLKVLGVHVDGGMREQFVVPVVKLHRSEKLTFEQLALVEMLCIGAHAVNRAAPEADEWVLVIGAGPIGLSVIQFARATKANVIVMDTNSARLSFCKTQLGVLHTVVAGESAQKQILDLAGGDLPTAVFDATGSRASMMGAFNYVGHGGRLVFVGLFQGDVVFADPDFHRKEMSLLATRNATGADFDHAIRLLENGEVDTRPWVTHCTSQDAMIERFPTWLEPETGVIKAMIKF